MSLRFADACPIGVNRAGKIQLNPGPDFVFEKGDGLVVLAEDNDTYGCAPPARRYPPPPPPPPPPPCASR